MNMNHVFYSRLLLDIITSIRRVTHLYHKYLGILDPSFSSNR